MKNITLKGFLFGALCLLSLFGCGESEDDLIADPDDVIANQIGVASDNANLKILVSYIDTTTFSGKRLSRLKLVDEAQYVASSGYKFLGRAYSSSTPGVDGFSLGLYEYYVPFGSPQSTAYGFQYKIQTQCTPGSTCPIDSRVFIPSEIAYVAPPQVNFNEGIVPLYQYWTPGGWTSGGNGNVSFTVDTREMSGLQAAGIPVQWSVIGSIYHGTKSDCSQTPKRSVFCDLTY